MSIKVWKCASEELAGREDARSELIEKGRALGWPVCQSSRYSALARISLRLGFCEEVRGSLLAARSGTVYGLDAIFGYITTACVSPYETNPCASCIMQMPSTCDITGRLCALVALRGVLSPVPLNEALYVIDRYIELASKALEDAEDPNPLKFAPTLNNPIPTPEPMDRLALARAKRLRRAERYASYLPVVG